MENSENKWLKRRETSDVIVEQKTPDAIRNGLKIFVVGPPRSGTTLLYSMIANEFFLPECTFVSTLLKVFDEIYKFSDNERFTYYGHNLTNLAEIFKKPINDFLYTAMSRVGGNTKNQFVFKDPMLTLYLEYFPLIFDHSYKIVFCVRDPRDVVSSMFSVFKKQHTELGEGPLFGQAINFIFPFYREIHKLDNAAYDIDKKKIIFVKYENIVKSDDETIRNLEEFLGSRVNRQVENKNLIGKLDESDAFYSENYGKAITTSPMGRYKKTLTYQQVSEIESVFSYYLNRFEYS